ncbi:MAG TPA: glycine cleavage system aminomethyltransferase GcvT [Cytophagaceae bacterium]|jgi:aminomethyltransferase|nr:glycine cleavage system aminomethyltransferase GcvT [Cytophagaceae bacterium]
MDILQTTLKKVPLNDLHEKLGAKMVPFAGFYMPVRYSSDVEEHNAVRNAVGVFDVSHMGEFVLSGEKALDLIQKITTNDASVLEIGKAQYSCFPNGKGGIVDDIIVYRTDINEYVLVVNASNIDKDWEWIKKNNTEGVEMTNLSEDLCLFAVQGPKALATIQKLTPIQLSNIPYYAFTTGEFAGAQDVHISNTGYTGAGGFELFLDKKDALNVWNKLFEAGAEFGIKPIGLGARDTLRLEMGYCLYGNDIDDTTSPIEAGLGWITKFTKKFIDADLLLSQKDKGVSRKLVGFEMIDRGIARGHYEIVDESGTSIGHVTSGTQSPTLGKAVGIGYVKAEYAQPGKEIFITIRNKPYKAQVVKMPFLKK